MAGRTRFVGRGLETERLCNALDAARSGQGSLLLVAGEAGIGKSRLVDEVADTSDTLVLRAAAVQGTVTPYGPFVAALRAHLRSRPDALGGCGPLAGHLAMLLPELGGPAPDSDRATLFEAVRCAIAHLAADRGLLLVLEDLHWSDAASLELLSGLAEPLEELPVALVATYRSDGLPRDHGLRRLRNDLRRGGRLHEVVLQPLSADEAGEVLADILGAPPATSLTNAIHDRTGGLPFYTEELARALASAGMLREGPRGLDLAVAGEVPLPDSVRDAVLLGVSDLSDEARASAEAAAVAGEVFDIDLVARLVGDAGLSELLAHGLLHEDAPGTARFRHALTRESLYAGIPWLRRRALHRQVAEALEHSGAAAAAIATQWVGARDNARACDALLRAAAESEAIHAYRDAADAGRLALELWPDSQTDPHDERRLAALERYARCSELAGDMTEAVRAWRELGDVRASREEHVALAQARRRLAAVYDLKGEREPAFAMRRLAAESFLDSELPAEAALDHLAMANHLRLAGNPSGAAELAATAVAEANRAGRLDIKSRALGLQGLAVAKVGDYEHGLRTVREGLALAIEHAPTSVAAELYQRLSIVLYEAADYRKAAAALETALDLCRADGRPGVEEACVSCLAYVLRDLGEWQEATKVCRELIAAGGGVYVGEGLLGSIHAYQGRPSAAKRLLTSSLAVSSRLRHYNMTVDSTAALAFVAAHEGHAEEAAAQARTILARWEESEDYHYALSGLRWSAVYLARAGDRASADAFTNALTTIASATGYPEALASLAHAIAELALLDGDPETASAQLTSALDLHRSIDMPYVRAQIELRAGVALAAAGDVDGGVERLAACYRTARKLGARPLAAEAARETSALGASVVGRLGSRAEADADAAGLSRREREVVRLLASGRTNREIAQELFLSPRTVDMHVRNILRKLDCRSRMEAATRAGELGLVA